MNIYDFAVKLDGRQYLKEITKDEEKQAKLHSYVVVFGYSDDNIEFRGAIDDEIGCYSSREIYLDADGLIEECECECKHWKKAKDTAKIIKAMQNDKASSPFWIFETDIPHATFDIYEDGEKYCEGIVFDLRELE